MKEVKRYRPDMVEDPSGTYVLFSDVSHLLTNEEVETRISQLDTMAEIVREIRFCCGLSQDELAKLVGVDSGFISKIEKGKAQPSIRLIAMMLVKAREKSR